MSIDPATRNLREPAPRQIGLFTKITTLFGGWMQQFGWIFFTMGSLFAWIFIPASEVMFWFEKTKNWEQTTGTVMTVESTNSSVNDRPVHRYFYTFEVEGRRYTGQGYGFGNQFAEGEKVTLFYQNNHPENNYIKGLRKAVFPALVLVVLIFPLVGLGFISWSVRSNLKALRLLEIGEFTRGKLMKKTDTNGAVTINGRRYPIYKYEFEFKVGGQPHTATCKTHQGWLVEDEEREIILYDRFEPDFHIVFDAAPNLPQINEAGMLEPAPLSKALNLVLPLLGLVVNGWFYWSQETLIR